MHSLWLTHSPVFLLLDCHTSAVVRLVNSERRYGDTNQCSLNTEIDDLGTKSRFCNIGIIVDGNSTVQNWLTIRNRDIVHWLLAQTFLAALHAGELLKFE